MTHNKRWEYMVNLGKQSINNQEINLILMDLALSNVHYERMLALMSAHGSFNVEIIKKLLIDASTIGVGSVLKLAAKHLDFETLADIIPNLSKNKRYIIAKKLLKINRCDVIEYVFENSDAFIQNELLFYTSEKFFQEQIDENQISGFSKKQWERFANRFPEMANEEIEAILSNKNELSLAEINAIKSVILELYKNKPFLGLKLLEKAMERRITLLRIVEKYSIIFPQEIAQLMLIYDIDSWNCFSAKSLKKLKIETLCELVSKTFIINIQKIFCQLKSEQRNAIHKRCSELLRHEFEILPITYLKSLPKEEREKEALHEFNMKYLETRPKLQLEYLSVISFSQALPLLKQFISNPDVSLRGRAISVLVQTGKYYRCEFDLILDFCLKRENEQDHVKLELMEALYELPPSIWTSENLSKLSLIISSVINSRDCSKSTMTIISRLLFKLISLHTNFVIEELPKLIERMGNISVMSLKSIINDDDFIKIDNALIDLLKILILRDNVSAVVNIISSFECRIKSVHKKIKDKMLLDHISENSFKRLNSIEILINLTNDKRGDVARLGLETLVNLGINDEVSTLIPKLLEKDSSWINVNFVSEHLTKYRQDLLTPFLTPNVYKNRFSSGKKPILISYNSGFYKWTEKQQKIYENSLKNIIFSTNCGAEELYCCVKRLSRMPSADIKTLIKISSLESKDIILRDKGIEALGIVDAGRGLETLVEALNDNRSRIAIFALRCTIFNMPSKEAIELLKNVTTNKITVKKEIIRLIGEFPSQDTFDFLCKIADTENLHTDIRIALLKAFWKYLNYEEVWKYFHMAAQSDIASLANSTTSIPQEGLTSIGKSHLCKQITLLLKNQNEEVRRQCLYRLVDMPIKQCDYELFEVLSDFLLEEDEYICKNATIVIITAFIKIYYKELVAKILKINSPKVIVAIVDGFLDFSIARDSALKKCVEDLSFELIKQSKAPTQILRLVFSVLSASKIIKILDEMENYDILHPGVIESNVNNWNLALRNIELDEIHFLEQELRSSSNVKKRRLGLALLVTLAHDNGWIKEYKDYLLTYKNDCNLWVSEFANLIEPWVSMEF